MAEVQVNAAHYRHGYNTRERYYSYVEQLVLVQQLQPREVIEIGIGMGFVTRELRANGLSVQTMDLDPQLGPDVIGSVDELPFPDGSCDLIICCEVLEHLPFNRLGKCLREMRRVSRRHVIVSVPNVSRAIRLEIGRGLNPGRQKRIILSGSLRRPRPHVFNGQHYWEIGKRGFTVNRVEKAMREAGFEVQRSYRLYLNPYHHFFVNACKPLTK